MMIADIQTKKTETHYDWLALEKIIPHRSFTKEAWVRQGSNGLEVRTNSLITCEDCAGHFGNRPESLKIPLLIVTDIMLFAVEFVAKILFPSKIAVPIRAFKIKAKIEELMPPPAEIATMVSSLEYEGDMLKASAKAYVNGRLYAESEELIFSCIPQIENIVGQNGEITKVPEELFSGYNIEEEIYRSEITGLIEEREPFLNLDKAIILKAGESWRIITLSRVSNSHCFGKLKINEKLIISPVDYAKAMAISAELLVSYICNRANLAIVPLAVQVKGVNASCTSFFTPPMILITKADISDRLISQAMKSIHKKRRFFGVDEASVIVKGEEVSSVHDLLFILVPKTAV